MSRLSDGITARPLLSAGMRTRLNAKHTSSAGIRSNGLEIADLQFRHAGRWAAWVTTVPAGADGARAGAHSGGVLRV
jgi:hypothetical protein